jgi:hypothetical protein
VKARTAAARTGGKPVNPQTYFPVRWQARAVKHGKALEGRERRQVIGDGDPRILGEVLLRGIQESA